MPNGAERNDETVIVDFLTGPKAKGPTRPQPADKLWAENNTDMPILGICIKNTDFPSINYL
jgi:hypothetical protein